MSPKTLLITGASGFIGQYVVTQALQQGYRVRATSRSNRLLPWHDHPNLEIWEGNLLDAEFCLKVMTGVDSIIHLAAAMQGSFEEQYASTVTVTETILNTLAKTNVKRLVAITSFSVFDYQGCESGTLIDENAPLEASPTLRDTYAQTKIMQEEILRKFQQETKSTEVVIIRPGMVYGREHLWNARLGIKPSSNLWLLIGGDAKMPLTYVENCAEALVKASVLRTPLGTPMKWGDVRGVNLVDDDLPTQQEFCQKLISYLPEKPRLLTINWLMVKTLSQIIWQGNKSLFQTKLKLPGLFVPKRLHARYKPMEYTNQKAKQTLEWSPRYTWDEALQRIFSDADLLKVSHKKTIL